MTDDRAVPMTPEERKAFRAELDAEQRAADRAATRRQLERGSDPANGATRAQADGPMRAAREREGRRQALEDELRGERPLTSSERQARALLGR